MSLPLAMTVNLPAEYPEAPAPAGLPMSTPFHGTGSATNAGDAAKIGLAVRLSLVAFVPTTR